MAESKVLQFAILISFVIFSTQALKVLLTEGIDPSYDSGFNYETNIHVRVGEDGKNYYNSCDTYKIFTPARNTTRVIVNLKDSHELHATRYRNLSKRVRLAQTLLADKMELLYLGVEHLTVGYERVIGEFIVRSINISQSKIATCAPPELDLNYETSNGNLTRYATIQD